MKLFSSFSLSVFRIFCFFLKLLFLRPFQQLLFSFFLPSSESWVEASFKQQLASFTSLTSVFVRFGFCEKERHLSFFFLQSDSVRSLGSGRRGRAKKKTSPPPPPPPATSRSPFSNSAFSPPLVERRLAAPSTVSKNRRHVCEEGTTPQLPQQHKKWKKTAWLSA